MNNRLIFHCIILGLFAGLYSCKEEKVGILNTGNFKDTAGALKTTASGEGLLFGMESDYPTVSTNAVYLATIAREAQVTTFGYEMKHGAIVQNDGSFNYTNTDAQFNTVTNAGLQVHGHNLNWYQNNNATYLKSVVGASALASAPNLITNGDFENWSGSTPTGWSYYNQSNGAFSQGSGAGAVESGSSSLEVSITTSGGAAYNMQIASSSFNTVKGDTYQITFYVKANSGGQLYQVEDPYQSYTGTISTPTTWTAETYTFTGTGSSTFITFDMGASPAGSVSYIDNVSVIDYTAASNAPVSPATTKTVDSLMQLWISGPNGIVTRYAGKVKAWDVVNEPMSDLTGGVRTSANTTIPSPEPSDWFFWSNYLGRDYAVNAFKYAKAADPNALLWINDYNLESNTTKLDSLIAYIKEIRGLGAPIDGVGTEMHININNSYAGIDAAFQALAATGLKVRVSELDVRLNPQNKTGFDSMAVSPVLLAYQAAMYQYVVSSYLKNVPAAQRYGITVWGVDDPDSWIITSEGFQDAPLLFDKNFVKKPAYAGVLQALQGK